MTNYPPSDEPGSDAGRAEYIPPDYIDDTTLQPEQAEAHIDGGEQETAEMVVDDTHRPESLDNEQPVDGNADPEEETQESFDDDQNLAEHGTGDDTDDMGSAFDAINSDMSDNELLAAASSSLHDDADMVNSLPGAAGADPTNNDPTNNDTDFGAPKPNAGAGSNVPGGGGYVPPQPAGPPPGYQPIPPVRRVYRSRHDRRLGGVSAGIAEFFRVDPTLVRLATLVTAFTGIGVLVYVAAWFIIPLRPEGFIEAPRAAPVANERTMTLAFGIAALALTIGIATGSWTVLAVALIGGGVWLLSEHTAIAPGFAGAAPVPGMSNYQAPSGFEPGYVAAPGSAPHVASTAGFVPAPPTSMPAAPVRERRPQRITWTVLSLLALLTAVGLAGSTGDWWDVSATRFLGVGVIIIGIGVVAGQLRRGGARGLIPLGILAALALFPVSAVDGLLDNGVGEATYRPTSIAELEDKYEHGIGQLVVDLSELDFDGRSETIDIDLGIGELIVIVSGDTGGQAVLQAKAGEVSHMLPNTNSLLFEEGVNIETGVVVLEGENGTLDLNINVGLGTAELRSEAN